MKLNIVRNDPWLEPFSRRISDRHERAMHKESELVGKATSLKDFASGHLFFGMHRETDGWIFREWAPNAEKIYLIGEFNNWDETPDYMMEKKGYGNWEIKLPLDKLKHGNLYRLSVHWKGDQGNRIPAWANRVVQDRDTLMFNAQVWAPEKSYTRKKDWINMSARPPIIYETHIGMASEECRVATFNEFRQNVLPRIIKGGYNTIQLMAVQEHPYYGSFGYHVSSFFAPSSRFGTPDELKELIDAAHQEGIAVIMDLVHSHSVKNEVEGLARFDGTPYQYFHDGPRRDHIAWDSLCFNYGKNEVLHFLLSNCRYWLEEFRFDGFRFDGVTSMLYLDHGLSRDFTSYEMYFDGQQDEDAIQYLMLANRLIKQVNPGSITIAEEMSGMPGLATSFDDGGIGFDYRLAMGTPDYWIKIIKERQDESWDISELYYELTRKRDDEKTISYAESHDQALVGDKTIIFRLMDKEMYDYMNLSSTNLIIDRGISLHKMIRLITIATSGGGYLNFMGNEFGHPEWIDFPREGNNWSYHYARRQWNLIDHPDLRYKFLGAFDREMISLITKENILHEQWPRLITANQGDQVLFFERGLLIFAFNFNPQKSFTDYGFAVEPGKYQIVLNTDAGEFGGQGLVDTSMIFYSFPDYSTAPRHMIKVYLPARSALVFKRIVTRRVYGN
ncbi:MAG: 1,4-alpha-glucan branching protein [Bacteroides sp. SM23_62_1]|nr:MAG: 1,4-alpha-glucan branching protein [Bacteroides sp. SM23_62_1]